MTSAGHVYGQRIIGAEAFTANDTEKWLGHPASLKALGDRAFCAGINRLVFHRYALQPWAERQPGMSMGPWGLHYERTQTWWEQSRPWHEYLARCQFLLRQGLPVVDLLYLAPDGAPRYFAPPAAIEHTGYKADACPTEALLQRVTVHNGLLTLPDGMPYRALVLPGAETMTTELLQRLEVLSREGATIIGAQPHKTPGLSGYPAANDTLRIQAEALWQTGGITTGKTPQQVLSARGVAPDFTADRALNFIHRRDGNLNLYFVANPSPHAVSATCSFRVAGKRPELWHGESGVIEPATVYEEVGGVTRLPLRLEAAGSVFVVFQPTTQATDHVVRLTRGVETLWPATTPLPKILIHHATWGPTMASLRTQDVTKHVQRLVDAGKRSFIVADLVDEGDPAPNVLKTLQVEYQVGDQRLSLSGTDPERITFIAPDQAKIIIRRALWGPVGEDLELTKRQKDVTAQVQRMVAGGATDFVVAELAAEGDPAPNTVKTLRVEYEVDGQVRSASATDPESMPSNSRPMRRRRRLWNERLRGH